MKTINKELYIKLEKNTNEIKEYINGYDITLMQLFAGNKIIEALIENNFLNDKLENIQINYFINK